MELGINLSPKETEALYAEHEGKTLIEVELHSMMQIFNSFDPAPFHEKELDADAEEYIYNSVAEFSLKKPLGLVIYLPCSEIGKETEKTLRGAVRNHFSYKKLLTEIELHRLLQRGRRNMAIAFVFLFLCLLMNQFLSTFEEDLLITMLSEGLTIIGWVAIWEPVNVFLYGWWPLVQKRNIYDKILGMGIRVISGAPGGIKKPDGIKRPEGNLFPNKS